MMAVSFIVFDYNLPLMNDYKVPVCKFITAVTFSEIAKLHCSLNFTLVVVIHKYQDIFKLERIFSKCTSLDCNRREQE